MWELKVNKKEFDTWLKSHSRNDINLPRRGNALIISIYTIKIKSSLTKIGYIFDSLIVEHVRPLTFLSDK